MRVVVRLAALAGVLAAACVVPAVLTGASASTTVAGVYAGGKRTAADPAGGFWTVSGTGRVHAHAGAPSYGSLPRGQAGATVVGIAATPDGGGYWLADAKGDVYGFGDASLQSPSGATEVTSPVVGITAAPDGRGYWLVAANGGVATYGDASFEGSAANLQLRRPVVGLASTPDGNGYWLVSSEGGVFAYGDASFEGSAAGNHLHEHIVGMASTPNGQGYWLIGNKGGVYSYGDASNDGSLSGTGAQVQAVLVNPSQPGYTLVQTNGTTHMCDRGSGSSGNSGNTGKSGDSGNTGKTGNTGAVQTGNTGSGDTGDTGGTSGTSSPVSPILGVYAGAGYPQNVPDFASLMGGQTKYAMEFLDGTSWTKLTNPEWFLDRWSCHAGSATCAGYHMIWGVPMLLDSGTTLAAEAAGDYDSYFTQLAQVMADYGQGDAIIRIGWEFNCCFAWYAPGQAANFIAAYQHVVDDFRSVAGTDFKFEWNPTLGDGGVGNLDAYYPGDAYVDYVGLDVYDNDWGAYAGIASEWNKWLNEDGGLNWLADFSAAHDKPMVFPEWGLGWGDCAGNGQAVSDPNTQVCGGDDPTFIDDMAAWFAAHNVFEATYWDYGSSTVEGGANPLTAAALKADFG